MASETSFQPMMGAENLNELVEHCIQVFRETIRLYLLQFKQSGYLPFTEPNPEPPTAEEIMAMVQSGDVNERSEGIALAQRYVNGNNGSQATA